MTDRLRRQPPHPIAKRYPAPPAPRIELDDWTKHRHNEVICDCFPKTSRHTIPSMFYDKIVCPHRNEAHIQPAQDTQFNYPWTANSISRKKAREEEELSERMSLISEEDEQLRFTPNFIQRHPPDVLSIATAPPYWYNNKTDPREDIPPYTAPAEDAPVVEPQGRRALSVQNLREPVAGKRAQSMQDIREPAQSRQPLSPDMHRKSRLSNRQFTGNYVDPKDGKVYKYNVNYNGTPKPSGYRQQQPPPVTPAKPTSAV